jgi:hypothetical protein
MSGVGSETPRKAVETMDRFDICDGYYVFGMLHHTGMGSREYGYLSRLVKLGHRPSPAVQAGKLSSEGARAVYRGLCLAKGV